MLDCRDHVENILQTPNPLTGAHMKIGDLYTYDGNVYLVKSHHPNPKRIILINVGTGKVFSVLKSIVRTGYTSSTQEGT